MFEEFMMMVTACENDVICEKNQIDGMYHLTIEDFEGFDDDWSEIEHEYAHPMEVDALEDWLYDFSLDREGDYYKIFHFEGFDVMLGYTSMDI